MAWKIHDIFKIGGDGEAILDFRDLTKVRSKNDIVQAFRLEVGRSVLSSN